MNTHIQKVTPRITRKNPVDSNQPKASTPVFLMPGWASTPEISFGQCMKELNTLGRSVISVTSPRTLQISEDDCSLYDASQTQKALSILHALAHENVDTVDLIAHSEGGINSMIAASMAPEKFRTLILIMPAGFTGADTPWRLVGRFTKDILIETFMMLRHPSRITPTFIYLFDILLYNLRNPRLALREIRAIAQTDVAPLISQLEKSGVEVLILAGLQDPVFPPKRLRAHLGNDHKRNLRAIPGTHGEMIMNAQKMMHYVDTNLPRT